MFVLSFLKSASFLDLFEGDILLDPKTDAIVRGANAFDAVAAETRKWPGAVVPYIFEYNFGKLTVSACGSGGTRDGRRV